MRREEISTIIERDLGGGLLGAGCGGEEEAGARAYIARRKKDKYIQK